MPILAGAGNITLQQIVTQMRAYPEFIPILGASGATQEPALSIANDVAQRIMSESMNWKWNREYVPPFLTVALQQDYCTQITDIGWLETAWRVDINNSTNNGNLAPKPIFPMEAVRDLDQTSAQRVPFQISFIPNTLAFLGQWYPQTAYSCGYGVAQIPIQPIQQFRDVNGNILYIDSTTLGLNINSPGFAGQPITLPAINPYGISGTTEPSAPPLSPGGTMIQDGTVTWTVADPNGYAMRISPLPAFSGLAWLIMPVYQSKPPYFSSLQNNIAPIPPEYTYLFRQGFRAMLYDHAGNPKAAQAYAKWEEDLMVAVKAADRQQEDNTMYPGESIMSGGSYWNFPYGIGAAWPFSGGPF